MITNDASNVSVGKPMVGGAVFRAPLGTALPTSAKATLDAAYENMGYISDNGVSNSNTRDTENVKAWGGDTVLQPQTGKTDTFNMTFLETIRLAVLKAVYGDGNVSGSLEEGIEISVNSEELDNAVWVIDVVMTGGVSKRVVIPNGKITGIGDTVYRDNEPIGFESTITAFPGSDGDTHKEYIAKGSDSDSDNTDSE